MILKNKQILFCFIVAVGCQGTLFGQNGATEEVRNYVIGNSRIRTVESKIMEQEYEINIALPYSYESNLSQICEMARRGGLRHIKSGYDVADAQLTGEKQVENPQSGLVRQRPKQSIRSNRGSFHIFA